MLVYSPSAHSSQSWTSAEPQWLIPGLPHGWVQEPVKWSTFHCFPRRINKCCRRELQTLWHGAGPNIYLFFVFVIPIVRSVHSCAIMFSLYSVCSVLCACVIISWPLTDGCTTHVFLANILIHGFFIAVLS